MSGLHAIVALHVAIVGLCLLSQRLREQTAAYNILGRAHQRVELDARAHFGQLLLNPQR